MQWWHHADKMMTFCLRFKDYQIGKNRTKWVRKHEKKTFRSNPVLYWTVQKLYIWPIQYVVLRSHAWQFWIAALLLLPCHQHQSSLFSVRSNSALFVLCRWPWYETPFDEPYLLSHWNYRSHFVSLSLLSTQSPFWPIWLARRFESSSSGAWNTRESSRAAMPTWIYSWIGQKSLSTASLPGSWDKYWFDATMFCIFEQPNKQWRQTHISKVCQHYFHVHIHTQRPMNKTL